MPGMNGMDFLRWLNCFEGLSTKPFVVMVTAENEKELILDSIDNGAVDFIVKPYTVDRVKRILRNIHKNIEFKQAAPDK